MRRGAVWIGDPYLSGVYLPPYTGAGGAGQLGVPYIEWTGNNNTIYNVPPGVGPNISGLFGAPPYGVNSAQPKSGIIFNYFDPGAPSGVPGSLVQTGSNTLEMINVRQARNTAEDPVPQNYGQIKVFIGKRKLISNSEGDNGSSWYNNHYQIDIVREILDTNYSGPKYNTDGAWACNNVCLDYTYNFEYEPSGYAICKDHPHGMLPTITGQMIDIQSQVGENITIGPEVSYGISYKWFKDGQPLATNFHPNSGSLQISDIQLSDSGEYHVRITNWYGETVSSGVNVYVSS